MNINNNAFLKIISLGGINTVTKNMYVYETQNDIIIVDCGLGFPKENEYGIDAVIPDITYLEDKKDKIRGVLITHGHDDHIGALPHLLPKLNCPLFSLPLTLGLIKEKLKEFGIDPKRYLREIKPEDYLSFGDFKIEIFRVSHSIPDAVGFVITSPAGIIVHTGDYKFDWTPVDKTNITDVAKIVTVGNRGVLALMSDCVRVENEGYTLSEREIGRTFDREFDLWSGRVFITTFSSNISRIQQAIDSADKHNRFVCLVGKSTETAVKVARELGYLRIHDNLIVQKHEIKKIPDKNLLFLVSGSQGQASSALTRISRGDHEIKIKDSDLIIFASDPVPGNEDAVFNVIDNLTKLGAEVYYSEITNNLHVSGHGSRQELMLMLSLVRPKYLIPISGSWRHLKHFSSAAKARGFPKENILLAEEGSIIEFSQSKGKINGRLNLKNIYLDGAKAGDVGSIVLKDRKALATDGIMVIIVPLSENNIGQIEVVTRGFIYVKESEKLINKTKNLVISLIKNEQKEVNKWPALKKKIEDKTGDFFYKETRRRPIVLPVFLKLK